MELVELEVLGSESELKKDALYLHFSYGYGRRRIYVNPSHVVYKTGLTPCVEPSQPATPVGEYFQLSLSTGEKFYLSGDQFELI